MSEGDPIVPDEIEVLESEPADDAVFGGPRLQGEHYVVQTDAFPCCTGCGCLFVCLVLALLFKAGPLLSGLLILIAAGWLAGGLVRLAGIGRFHPAYVYMLVPLFLAVANALGHAVHGKWLYGWREVVAGTLVVYLFVWVLRRIRI